MPFIQLSTLSLPATAGRDKVFPFLYQESGAIKHYSLAVLVSKANVALIAALELFHFQRDTTVSDLGAGWVFYRAGTGGPFLPLTDDGSASSAVQLATYLTFTFAGTPAGDVWKPATLHVNTAALQAGCFNPSANLNGNPAFLGLKRNAGAAEDWNLAFAGSNNTDTVAVAMQLPVVSDVNLPARLPAASFLFALSPLADNGATWGGCGLAVNHVPLVGGLNDRIAFDGGALLTRTVTSTTRLVYEWAPLDIDLPFGPGGMTRIRISSEIVTIRVDGDNIGIYLLLDWSGEPVVLNLDISFSLITGNVPEAPAFLLPLKNNVSSDSTLKFRFSVQVDGEWPHTEQPVFSASRSAPVWSWQAFLQAAAAGQWGLAWQDRARRACQFSGMTWNLKELFGDKLGEVRAELLPPQAASATGLTIDSDFKLKIPFGFLLQIGGQSLQVDLLLEFDLLSFRLKSNTSSNRFNLRLPAGLADMPIQTIDLGFLAIVFPSRSGLQLDGQDGYLDFDNGEFVLFKSEGIDLPDPMIIVPGNLVDESISNRVLLRLKAFDPDSFPEMKEGPKKYFLRINRSGISFWPTIEVQHSPTIYKGPGKAIQVKPQQERNNIKSEIMVVDNVLRAATIFADVDVPGFDDLTAKVEIGLRQSKPGTAPILIAAVDLDSSGGMPLTQFSVGYLQMVLEDFRARLTWNLDNNDWDLSVRVDGNISLAPKTLNAGGLEDLRKRNAIVVRDLDLMNLHRGPGEIELQLDKVVEFDCLDGLFAVRLDRLQFGWGRSFFMSCETASFRFKQPGQLDVQVDVGGVRLEFEEGRRLKMRNPSKIGIDVRIGNDVRMRGAVAWVDNKDERYFAAAGTISIKGLPEATALLKLGSGAKENGQTVPNIVLYGAMDQEVPLFAGVVAKSFGAGIGINNRLTGIGERPNAVSILQNIDRIDPARLEGWEFVKRNGFFLSIVGTTILASNQGGNDTVNAYVASLVLSIDIDLNVVAAGKLWFSSCVDYVRQSDNWNRPALVGAIAMSPRDQMISAVLESRPNPAIQSNDRLVQLLNKGHIRLSFLLTPRLVDFYLEDVSYQDEFLGATMLYRGSFRLAIMDGKMLVMARQSITGHFDKSLSEGPGGFGANGAVNVLLEIGGLLSSRGLAAYGRLETSLGLDVRAWISIEFRITVGWGKWKHTWSYSKRFDLQRTRLELGLSGTAAFNESGSFGFDGKLSISVPICSYRLSIAPSLAINTSAIDNVRERVSAFEQRIDAVRQELLGGGRSRTRQLRLESLRTDTWLHYSYTDAQQETWHLLIPRADAVWLTPMVELPANPDSETSPIFKGSVTSIHVSQQQPDQTWLELAEVHTPWIKDNFDKLPPNSPQNKTDAFELAELWMTETSQPVGEAPYVVTPLDSYHAVRDPRVESGGRAYWTDEDRVLLPDFALPLRFRSAEEFLAAQGLPESAESDYQRLVEYLYWQAACGRHNDHRGTDEIPGQRAASHRATVIRMLLDIRGAADAPDYASVWLPEAAYQTEAHGKTHWYGMWFRLPAGVDWTDANFKVEVTRHSVVGDATVEVTTHSPATDFVKVQQQTQTLMPRQEFVVDVPGGDNDELGRVVVKLPLFLSDKIIPKCLPAVAHWQVWRQLPWESQPVLIGDFLQPQLDYLDDSNSDRHIVIVRPYLFSDSFPVKGRVLQTPGIATGITEIEYSVKPVPVGGESAPAPTQRIRFPRVRLYVPPRDTFPASLSMLWPATSIDDGTAVEAPGWGRFVLAMPDDDPETPGRLIPARLDVDDFELWAEATDLPGSGYYSGEEQGLSNVSGRLTSIEGLRGSTTSRSFETLHGKFLVKVVPIAEQRGFGFRISDASRGRLIAGKAYRFLVRPRLTHAGSTEREGLGGLRPLPLFLVRQIPKHTEVMNEVTKSVKYTWREAPSTRSVSHLEFIPHRTWTDIRAGQILSRHLLPVLVGDRQIDDVVARQTPRAYRTRLGVYWNMFRSRVTVDDGPIGGVELYFRDLDDPVLQDRVLVEAQKDSAFRVAVQDFRNASAWRLTPGEQSLRISSPATLPTLWDPARSQASDLTNYFLFLGGNPLLTTLANRKTQLDTSTDSWLDLLPAAKNFLTALIAYRKSPLNINDPQLVENYGTLEFLLRHAFSGLFGSDDVSTAACARLDQAVAALISEINGTTTSNLPVRGDEPADRADARRSYLDMDLARHLAGIVRRRLIIAREIFSNEDNVVPQATEMQSEQWPRETRFSELVQDVDKFTRELGTLDRCRRLLALFPQDAARRRWAHNKLKDELNRLLNLVSYLKFDPVTQTYATDKERKALAAKTVSQASGLTVALQTLANQFGPLGWKIVRRPHHQLSVGETAESQKRPEPTQLVELLSDEMRLSASRHESLTDEPNLAAELPALLHVFERLGFAVDLAVIDSIGLVIEQDDLVRKIQDAGLPQVIQQLSTLPHRTFVVLGREPDSEHQGAFPDPAQGDDFFYVGYSFIKLVVLPVELCDLLSSRLQVLPGDTQAVKVQIGAAIDELKAWFAFRTIVPGNTDEETRTRLIRLGELYRYLCEPLAANGNAVSRIRMESRDKRWVGVPVVDGQAHLDWSAPDQKGHRLQHPQARVVSRYEPLVRWADQNYQLLDWPADVLEPEVTIRRIVAYNRPEELELALDMPEQLSVAVHPHAERIQFSVTLPSAAARSIYNLISAVRTGYSGYTLAFQYHLRDHEQTAERGWDMVLGKMQYLTSGTPLQDPVPYLEPQRYYPPHEPRLLRHERLVTLDRMPYFYEYVLESRSQYDLRFLPGNPDLPAQGPVSAARREPGLLAMRLPQVSGTGQPGDVEGNWQVTFWLTRLGDQLSPDELAASPPLVPRPAQPLGATGNLDFPPERLPDPAAGYLLHYQIGGAANDPVFIPVAQLLMPWHTLYRVSPNAAEHGRPCLQLLDSRVSIAGDAQNPRQLWPEIECGDSEYSVSGFTPAYRVRISLKTSRHDEPELIFSVPGQRASQMLRSGRYSQILPTDNL